jgi:hypothetical protein
MLTLMLGRSLENNIIAFLTAYTAISIYSRPSFLYLLTKPESLTIDDFFEKLLIIIQNATIALYYILGITLKEFTPLVVGIILDKKG